VPAALLQTIHVTTCLSVSLQVPYLSTGPNLLHQNMVIRDAGASAALYFAEMPGSASSACVTLHNGNSIEGSVAACMLSGQGVQASTRPTAQQPTLIKNIPDYGTALCAAQNRAPLEKRLAGQASFPIIWKQGKMGKACTLVDPGTGRRTGTVREVEEES
jgi:hypothetical protein